MDKGLSRRTFIKQAALGTAATVLVGCGTARRSIVLEPHVGMPEYSLPGQSVWFASTCRQCPAACGILVRTANGRAKIIEGNPAHPLNQGKLCARGQGALQVLYNPDRLRDPVRQVGGRGSRRFEPVRWPEALDEVARDLSDTPPKAIAFLGGATGTHVRQLVDRFIEALGAPEPVYYELHSAIDGRNVLSQAMQTLFGTPALPVFDIANSEALFSFGANLFETWLSPVAYGVAYGKMRRGRLGERGYLVQFEPRMSSTAASADEWIPIRPGSEGLVALALGKIILEENLFHAPVSEHKHDHDALAAFYQDVEVGEIATASDVSATELERLARLFADTHHPLAIPGGRVAGQSGGLEAVRAILALNAAMDNLGEHGGLFITPDSPLEALSAAQPSTYEQVRTLIQRMRSGEVELLFIHAANPVFELPPASGFAEALREVPKVVSFGQFVDETGVQADLILPDHTPLESWGYEVVSPGADRPVISGQQPVVRAVFNTRATADVFLALAQTLGGELSEALPWQDEVDYIQEQVAALRAAVPDGGALSPEGFWVRWRQQGGWWPEAEAEAAPSYAAIEFGEPQLEPSPYEGSPTDFPFFLQVYESVTLGVGAGAAAPWLQETPDPMTTVSWRNWIEIHPETAHHLGLKSDDVVLVKSPYGEVEAVVYEFPGIRPDVVGMPLGQGHTDMGRYAAGRGSSPIQLLPAKAAPNGELAWASVRVQVKRTGKRRALARLENVEGIEEGLPT